MRIKLISGLVLLLLAFLSFQASAHDISSFHTHDGKKKDDGIKHDPNLSIYTGMFDFSDDGKRAALIGIQHQNENLFRDSFLGKISPVTGTMITESNSLFLYTGVQAEYDLGKLKFTPSFTPGYYHEGDGKDLGYPLEFKSEVQLSLDLSEDSNFGISYNHISNASLGDKNPGANSYMFNFLKRF